MTQSESTVTENEHSLAQTKQIEQSEANQSNDRQPSKIFQKVLAYLSDWKNILAHSLVGIAILSVAIWLPVEPIYRVIILALVVTFNIIRMRCAKKKTV